MNKIFIGFPTYDRRLDIEILFSIVKLKGDFQLMFDFHGSSIVQQGRNYLVERFLESDCEWLYFWDTDIVIHDDTFLDKLIETSKKLDAGIVGAAYRMKNPDGYVIGGMLEADGKVHNLKSKEITEPRIVDAVGTGTMLIRRDVLETMPNPWFTFVDHPGWVMPEDYNFCLKAAEYGFKTAMDPRIITLHYGQAPWAHIPEGKALRTLYARQEPEQNT